MRQERPNNARVFVRQSYGGNIRITPFGHTHQPSGRFFGMALEAKQHGTGTVDQQSSQVRVATFTDAEQLFLAAARLLPWEELA